MVKKIKIESDIPMPTRSSRYPWDILKVGESFKVNGRSNPRQLAKMASKRRAPKKFEARMVHGVNRIWRTN